MTAAETLFLEEQSPAGVPSAAPEPAERPLHIVTDEDVRAAQAEEAARTLQAQEFVVNFATNALSAVMNTEPYRTSPDGTKVPAWLYHYRCYRYERTLKPARARRERALAAQTAARTTLLNLTAGEGELWPDPVT